MRILIATDAWEPQVNGVVVTLRTVTAELERQGHLAIWGRGVDLELFRPRPKGFLNLPRPIFLHIGRVAVEKNLKPFLELPLAGGKLVVGDGPSLAGYRRYYPDVEFVGAKFGEELASYFAAADVFVFPSRTDTFGLVLLEALASGLPVAAYPVTGPIDVINGADAGVLDEDLTAAARRALAIPPARCRAFAERFSWRTSAAQFLANLAPFPAARPTFTAVEAEPGPAASLGA